jgi:hypothetical protein
MSIAIGCVQVMLVGHESGFGSSGRRWRNETGEHPRGGRVKWIIGGLNLDLELWP